jgi:hypothetical protein
MIRASLIAGACVLVMAAVAVLDGCYPKKCDPAKDPLRCTCPPGPCGPYPSPMPVPDVRMPRDAGSDG